MNQDTNIPIDQPTIAVSSINTIHQRLTSTDAATLAADASELASLQRKHQEYTNQLQYESQVSSAEEHAESIRRQQEQQRQHLQMVEQQQLHQGEEHQGQADTDEQRPLQIQHVFHQPVTMVQSISVSPTLNNQTLEQATKKSGRRVRTTFSSEQKQALEQAFEKTPYPDAVQREQIAFKSQIPEARVQVWFSNKRAKLRRQDKNEELKMDKQHFSSQPQFIALPQHSQIIHPSAIPIIPGQFAISPHMLEGERRKAAYASTKQVVTSEMHTFPDGQPDGLQAVLIPSTHGYEIAHPNEAIPTYITPTQGTPITVESMNTTDKSAISVKTETPPLAPVDTSKLSNAASTQIIYLLQTGPKHAPSYVAYVVPKTVPVSDIVTSSHTSWSVYDSAKSIDISTKSNIASSSSNDSKSKDLANETGCDTQEIGTEHFTVEQTTAQLLLRENVVKTA